MVYDKLSQLAQRVITGKATIARLDKDEEQGRIAGGRRNVEATIVLGASFEHHKSQQQSGGWDINKEAARQKAVLKAYTAGVEDPATINKLGISGTLANWGL